MATQGWYGKDGPEPARLLLSLLKRPDEYFLECVSHDSNKYRSDPTAWYQEGSFEKTASLIGVCRAEFTAAREAWQKADSDMLIARNEEVERNLMHAYDVNVNP